MSSFKKQMLKLKKQEILLKLSVLVLSIVLNNAPPIVNLKIVYVEQHQTINNRNDNAICSSLFKPTVIKQPVTEQE